MIASPYHGTVDKAHQDEVYRSKAICGTTHLFTYVTAYAMVRGHRYTQAMYRVQATQSMPCDGFAVERYYALRTYMSATP